ncbi:MAG: chemotaxis protein CheW [Aliidongia sp.]
MSRFGFTVSTPACTHVLPLDAIVELSDTLPVGPAAEPLPAVSGVALFRDEILPVISLDVLLGESLLGERGWEEREWGGFAVVAAGGRRCVLAVARIGRLVGDVDPAATLDLARLLAEALPPAAEPELPPLAPLAAASRYLLAEIGGRRCAFRLDTVERVQDECRIVRAPYRTGSLIAGVAAVEGRVLPVLDARALLGLNAATPPGGFVVAADAEFGRLIVAVDRIAGFHAIEDDALDAPLDGVPASAVAITGGQEIWILSAGALAGAA